MDDADCPAGKDCDPEELICVQASITTNSDPNSRTDPNNRVPPNSSNPDMGNNDGSNNAPDMGSNNTSNTPNNTSNTPNNTSNNPNNNTNNSNTCTPACEAPGTCVNGECQYPDCGAAFDPCDPSTTSQGGFTCIDVDGQGVCLDPCNNVGTIDVCGAGEYCVGWDGNPVCLPSVCDTNADCTDGTTAGTCLHIDNDFNYCKIAGTLAVNDSCDPADDQCGVGQACDPRAQVCEPVCDPYGAASCGAGHYCASFWSPRTGICSHDTASGSLPLSAFDECTPAGSVCDDAAACFSLDATLSVCLKYCRPGANDCAGVQFFGDPTVCDPYALFTPGTGICWPACATDADCGTGSLCLNQLCRVPCTAGNEVADCCGGSTPCPAICNNNLCE